MWNKRQILSRLKSLTDGSWFSPGIEKEEKYTRYWEGYRTAMREILETDEKFRCHQTVLRGYHQCNTLPNTSALL